MLPHARMLPVHDLASIAQLVDALNRPHELKLHLRGAINNGCTLEELQEILLHAAVYCGLPAAGESAAPVTAAPAAPPLNERPMPPNPPSAPSKDLHVFPNPAPERDYVIQFQVPEFTCHCPLTGQPDFAHLVIDYVPDAWLVESKSLKLYLWSYRNEGAFHEAVTNRILDDLVRAVAPRWMRVVLALVCLVLVVATHGRTFGRDAGVAGSQRSSVAYSCGGSTGLATWSFMPASRQATRSSPKAFFASERAESSACARSAAFSTMRIPLPPPPADALIITG